MRQGVGQLAWVGVAASIALALGAAFGRDGADPQVDLVAFADGVINTSSSGEGEAILSAGGLAPGHSARGEVTVRNDSLSAGRVTLSQRLRSESLGAGGGRLFDDLWLTIRQSGGKPDGLVYAGPLSAIGPRALRRFRAGESRTYAFEVAMPDTGVPTGPANGDNAQQGGSVSVDYVWSANSLNRPAGRCRHGVLGTPHADVLRARERGERVLARAGDDRITGSRFSDCLFGGRGDDVVLGRVGADVLHGGLGRDLLRGGDGNDVLRAADGDFDRLRCGAGNDTAVVDAADTVTGCERVTVR